MNAEELTEIQKDLAKRAEGVKSDEVLSLVDAVLKIQTTIEHLESAAERAKRQAALLAAHNPDRETT